VEIDAVVRAGVMVVLLLEYMKLRKRKR